MVATAHATGLVREGLGLPGDGDYWARIASGGVAMVITGATITARDWQPRSGNLIAAAK